MECTPAMTASPLFRGIPAAELEALLDCMGAARRRYRDAVVDDATIDEILLLYVKGACSK